MKHNNTNWIYGVHPISSLLHSQPEKIHQICILDSLNFDQNSKLSILIKLAQSKRIKIVYLDKFQFSKLLGKDDNSTTQNIMASVDFSGFIFKGEAAFKTFLDELKFDTPKSVLILDSIQDPHNVGAILRTAAGLGVDAVVIPKDNSCPINATVFKTSSGAISYLKIFEVVNLSRVIKDLKDRNFWIYGSSLRESSVSLYKVDFKDTNIALIMGSEGTGLKKIVESNCDYLIKIPLCEQVESFNVSVATGIILSEIRRQIT